MNKYEAINKFWNGFSIPAYVEGNIPDGAVMPYITYNFAESDMYSGATNNIVDIWYYSQSEAMPNAKLAEISEAFGLGGIKVKYDGGLIWLKKGSPWAQALTDPNDKLIKRRTLNVLMEIF